MTKLKLMKVLGILDRNNKYSFQLSVSGRSLPMTVDEFLNHPEFPKEDIISIDDSIGMYAKRIWGKYK